MKKRIAVVGCLVAVSVVLFVLSFVPSSRVYSVEAELLSAPINDEALVDWLNHSLAWCRTRYMRSEKSEAVVDAGVEDRLALTFIMTESVWCRPPFPNVEDAAARFGYSLSPAGFVDQRKRE